MMKPRILVGGAAGRIGGAVVAELLRAGWPVRALVHRADGRSEALARRGAEIAVADLLDGRQVAEAMRGTRRAFFVPPYAPSMASAAAAFADAARSTGLEAVVVLSQWLANPEHPALLTRLHWEADRLFATLPGIAHVTIAPGYFADNYLRLIDFTAQLGLLPNLTGDSRNAPPSNEDIAAVAAAVLRDPGPHGGRRYRPTGPDLLSVPRMAEVLSGLLGRRVRAVPMPFGLFVRAARLQGVPPFDLSSLRHYVEDHRQGAFELGAPSDDVQRVTGRPAEPFEATARRYAALPAAHRTVWSSARAWWNLLRTPFGPGYDLAAYERELAAPRPEWPVYAMQNVGWRAEREAPSAWSAIRGG